MDDNVKRRVFPVDLRAAVVPSAWQRLRAERLKAGDWLEHLEQQWAGVERTHARLECSSVRRCRLGWAATSAGALAVCNAGTHQPVTSNPHEAYADVRAVVQAIENKRS